MRFRTVRATQYVTALREGGSLPAIVAADDLGLYVLKFRGAGQGPMALVAELVAGEIGRELGLNVPELVFIEVDAALGRNEPDEEIRDLLKASVGLNLALDYLPGSTMFDPAAGDVADAKTASTAVWFDAFVMNVDRTPAMQTCCVGIASFISLTMVQRFTCITIGRRCSSGLNRRSANRRTISSCRGRLRSRKWANAHDFC